MRTSAVNLNAVLANAIRIGRHPWVASALIRLQVEKWRFALTGCPGRQGRARRIRQLSLRITDLCNLRCATCGQWGERGFLRGAALRNLRQAEVAPERYIETLDDIVRRGHRPILYIWGGEPMLYDGLMPVLRHAARLRMPASIATNGTRMAPMAREWVDMPLFLLQVSVDGHCADLHDRLRPSTGGSSNFEEISRGLAAVQEQRRAKRSALPLVASLTTVSSGNQEHLLDIYAALRDRVDLLVFYLSWWIDEDAAAAHERDFARRFGFAPSLHRGWLGSWRPTDPDRLARQLADLKRMARAGGRPVVVLPDITRADDLRRYYADHACTFGFDRCLSIYQTAEINSNGDLSPCRDYHDFVVGNIKVAPLSDLWNGDRYRQFRCSLARDGLMPACTRCCGLMGY
jgi:radical SAM protein with 4Fe4S-binding SPASM domain